MLHKWFLKHTHTHARKNLLNPKISNTIEANIVCWCFPLIRSQNIAKQQKKVPRFIVYSIWPEPHLRFPLCADRVKCKHNLLLLIKCVKFVRFFLFFTVVCALCRVNHNEINIFRAFLYVFAPVSTTMTSRNKMKICCLLLRTRFTSEMVARALSQFSSVSSFRGGEH